MKTAIYSSLIVATAFLLFTGFQNTPTQINAQKTMPQWEEILVDDCTGDWTQNWMLDGEVATVTNSPEGMVFAAGPEWGNHAHHGVLWTKSSFSGDLKIEYDFTRLDTQNQGVNILYLLATGVGSEAFPADIMKWADYRKEPWMKYYFENMNLLHISYAAYDFKAEQDKENDYVRARIYPNSEGFNNMMLPPDYFKTGLFQTGVTYHITATKIGDTMTFEVKGPEHSKTFEWESDRIASITEGRIGFRQMFTRSSRYANIRVYSRK